MKLILFGWAMLSIGAFIGWLIALFMIGASKNNDDEED